MFQRRAAIPSMQELLAFEAAGRGESFTRAARELSLTQGAVSRQIAGLEERLGTRLFDRERRRVRLTDAGRAYLREVSRLLAGLSDATDRVAAFGTRDVVNLAVLPTFGTRWLVPRLPRFAAGAPDVTVNCVVRSERFDFEGEPLDCAIHFGHDDWPGASALRLCDEVVVAVASPAFAARHGLSGPEDVARVVRLHQATRLGAWDEWLAAHGLPAADRSGPRFDQFGMLAEAAAAGLGVALVPRFLVEDDIARGRLAEGPGEPVRSDRAYWFVVPDGRAERPAVRRLRDWLVAETVRATNR